MNSVLKGLIDSCDLISFDIFDTLVYRCCGVPEDVFKIIGKQSGISSEKFKESRISAEKIAREKYKKEEITITDIYNCLDLDNIADIESIIELEKKIEIMVCKPNKEMLDVYNYCVKNKKIVITSDMYLDNSTIETILDNCGVSNYDSLFLSSELNKTKRKGSIFSFISEKYNLPNNKILHIGDNLKSDYIIPKKMGIKSFHYRGKNKIGKVAEPDLILLNSFLTDYNEQDFYYNFGYSIFGPAVYGYVKWLDKQLSERDLNKVYFFAREGEFIKKAFDYVCTGSYDENYLYVSRRSLTVPAIANISSLEDFTALRPVYSKVPVIKQIEKLGLRADDFSECEWYKKYIDKCFDEVNEKDKKQIIRDMFDRSKKNAEKEQVTLLEYLKQNRVCGRFAVVDLGWNGSMQRAMVQILNDNNIENDIIGFFLAQRDEYYKNSEYITNYGYLFNYGEVSKHENLLLNSGAAFLEFLFSASHGSTIKYNITAGKAEPVLDKYEFEDVYPLIKKCQDGAIDFIKHFSDKFDCNLKIDEKLFFKPMYDMLLNPSYEIIEKFGDICTSDMNEKDIYISKKVSVFSLKKLLKEFSNSAWKVAFLKRNFHTNHAFQIYSVLRKLFN